jgi:hypothetical protein
MPSYAVRVAECVYYNKEKIIHPYHLIITRNKVTFSRVFATLEEAVKAKERFQKTSSHELCEKTAEAL